MRSEIKPALLLVTILTVACSSADDPAPRIARGETTVDLGEAPRLNASPLTTTAVAADAVVVADPAAKAAHVVRLSPLRIERSLPLERTHANGGILVGPELRYVIGLSGSDVTVHGEAGDVVNPVILPGRRIASAAFDGAAGLVALADEFEALALIALTPAGAVEGAWLGGPILGDDGALGAGGFIGGGRLVSSLGGGRLAVVDVRASIAAQAWSYRVVTVEGLDRATFVARIPDAERLAVVGGHEKIFVLDTDSGAVVSSRELGATAGALSWSTLGRPHVLVPTADTAQPFRVVYTDAAGAFAEQKVKARVGAPAGARVDLEQTHLDPARGILTFVAVEQAGRRRRPRIRKARRASFGSATRRTSRRRSSWRPCASSSKRSRCCREARTSRLSTSTAARRRTSRPRTARPSAR